jgi:aspartate/methionine/tyrosine aminotransferase
MMNRTHRRLSPHVAFLESEGAFEVLSRADSLEAEGRRIVHLEIGQPDFPTPPNIVDAAARAVAAGHTGYGPPAGVPRMRELIAENVRATRGVDVDPGQVVVTPGAKPAIFFTLLAIAAEGDEVIYPDPGFPSYHSVIGFSGAHPVPLPLREDLSFGFDPDELRALVTPRTRAIIVNSPHNPTGGILQREMVTEIARLARLHGFWIITDEIYRRMLYDDNRHHSALVHAPDRTILVDGFSKSYSMTGWRLGYAVAPPDVASPVEKLMLNCNSCTCTFVQYAGMEALTGTQEHVRRMLGEFAARRELVVDGINAIPGLRCPRPAGAFYAFVNIQETGLDCSAFQGRLLEDAGVATLPGSCFGACGEGYVRLSYASSRACLSEALEKIAALAHGIMSP